MAESWAGRFINALHKLEDTGDTGPMLALFTDAAEIQQATHRTAERGREGAHHFWSEYRQTFSKVHSEFRNVLESGSCAVLEWTSNGTNHDGQPVSYQGVTVLELAEDGIRAMRAYFDAHRLGRQLLPA